MRRVAFLFLVLPAAAQSLKLNGPLARGIAGEFSFPPRTSHDGRFHVYTADHEGDGVFELYSVEAGGKPLRLFGPVPEYGFDPEIALDGASVLFVADLDGDASAELASVPIDGSVPAKTLVGAVASFQQGADGGRLVFTRQTASWVYELFSAPLDGSDPVKLSGPLVAGGSVRTFLLSSTGLAFYSADQDTDERVELFVVPIDGSEAARKLPIPLVQDGSIAIFRLVPDGSRVIYTADQEEDERYELFSVPTDGSEPPLKLNGPLIPGGDVGDLYPPSFPCAPYCQYYFYAQFNLSPDGLWVVYSAVQDPLEPAFDLYSVPSDGSRPAAKLNTEPVGDVFSYLATLSPDSAWVIYRSNRILPGEVFSVPIDGSSPARRISGPPDPDGRIPFQPQVSLDSRHVVYEGDLDVRGVFELYSAPVDGGAGAIKLSAGGGIAGTLTRNAAISFAGFSVLEAGVVYQADGLFLVPAAGGVAPRKLAEGPIHSFAPSVSYALPTPTTFDEILFLRGDELLSVETGGAPPVRLDQLPPSEVVVGDVQGFDLAPAGARVVYDARQQGDLIEGLYSVDPDKPFERARFSLPAGAIDSERFVPDGSRVVFLAAGRLYSASSDGGTPVRLDGASGASAYELTRDGRSVVFQAFDGERWSLFRSSVDGSTGPTLLHEYADPGSPLPVEISADGSHVAFLEDFALYAAPLDASAPTALVSTEGKPVADHELTRDGSLVVFRMGKVPELFVAPSDGSTAPERLHPPLPFQTSIIGFVLAPDSTRAVYSANRAGNISELFSVPIDGSALPVRLHPALPSTRDAGSPQISSDGLRVVYLSDALGDDRFELFGVPIDGSAQPVRLNGTLVTDGDVLDFRPSPDGKRVVYRADEREDGVFELFSVPIRGSRGPVRLSRPLVPGGDVVDYQMSADSRTVVFRAVRNAGGKLTLMAAPVTGQEKAVELAGPWASQVGSVLDYRLSADASVVVYRADQDEPGVIELHAARRSSDSASPTFTRR